jgi:hypothetical protein
MGGKITVVLIAIAGAIGIFWLWSTLSKNAVVAKAGTPGVTGATPINPTPAGAFASIPILGSLLSAFGVSPSPVSPAVIAPPTTSPEGGAATTSNFVQGPSYSQFLSQQTDAGIIADGALPLTPLPPSFVVPQTAIDTSAVLAAPDGIMPPGISTDPSDYSGTGDAYYS